MVTLARKMEVKREKIDLLTQRRSAALHCGLVSRYPLEAVSLLVDASWRDILLLFLLEK